MQAQFRTQQPSAVRNASSTPSMGQFTKSPPSMGQFTSSPPSMGSVKSERKLKEAHITAYGQGREVDVFDVSSDNWVSGKVLQCRPQRDSAGGLMWATVTVQSAIGIQQLQLSNPGLNPNLRVHQEEARHERTVSMDEEPPMCRQITPYDVWNTPLIQAIAEVFPPTNETLSAADEQLLESPRSPSEARQRAKQLHCTVKKSLVNTPGNDCGWDNDPEYDYFDSQFPDPNEGCLTPQCAQS